MGFLGSKLNIIMKRPLTRNIFIAMIGIIIIFMGYGQVITFLKNVKLSDFYLSSYNSLWEFFDLFGFNFLYTIVCILLILSAGIIVCKNRFFYRLSLIALSLYIIFGILNTYSVLFLFTFGIMKYVKYGIFKKIWDVIYYSSSLVLLPLFILYLLTRKSIKEVFVASEQSVKKK